MENIYQQKALDFLNKVNTTCTIEYAGYMYNENWNETEKRDVYYVTLKNKRGKYIYKYWDNLYNTEINHISYDDYMAKHPNITSAYQTENKLNRIKESIKLKEYEVLSCLTIYEPGTFENFYVDFGYSSDSISAYKIYMEVCKEWNGLSKMFTVEELEMLAEIQ